MSLGVWEPGKKSSVEGISASMLAQFVAAFAAADPGNLAASMSPDEVSEGARVMRQDEAFWQAADDLADDALISLAQFFTLAEMQLPGWEAGKQSPVIYLVSRLKARDAFTPELRRWIKANTDNRYLPHGAAL